MFWTELLEQYRKNRELIAKIYENNISHIVKDHIFTCCAAKDTADDTEAFSRAILAGAIYGLIDEWIRRDMPSLPDNFSIKNLYKGSYLL